MNKKTQILGHVLALLTIVLWGSTLISTKILYAEPKLNALNIVVYRFIIAYFVLLLIHPKFKKPTDIKEELLFLCAGLTGVTLYMFCQNIALTYSTASNISLVICTAPLFTAIVFHIFTDQKITKKFFIGFLIAFIGIFLVIFNGSVNLKLNPIGDILAVFTASVWAFYTLILSKIEKYNYNIIYATRKTFFYALLTMIPLTFILGIKFDLSAFANPLNTLNMLYLGVGASALAFIMWSKATALIGGVKTAAYIYLDPIVTITFAAIILHERITIISLIGCVFILTGLYVSDKKK